jgi:hypothetical protein
METEILCTPDNDIEIKRTQKVLQPSLMPFFTFTQPKREWLWKYGMVGGDIGEEQETFLWRLQQF